MNRAPRAGVLTHAPLHAIPGLVHGAVSRALVDPTPPATWARGLGFGTLVTPQQVHGARVLRVEGTGTEPLPPGDALVTDRPGILLGVLGADCPGVLLVDARRRCLAVVHSGWRGTAAAIVVRALEELGVAYGTRPEDVMAWIGPGISGACYEVDAAVLDAVAPTVPPAALERAVVPTRPGHARIDLATILAAQLRGAGVPDALIACAGVCTYSDDAWHSFRRDGGRAGRHLLVAGWRHEA